ncbi:hypothetical protein ACFPRL_32050 [Pseudoclavibacter helvolus]
MPITSPRFAGERLLLSARTPAHRVASIRLLFRPELPLWRNAIPPIPSKAFPSTVQSVELTACHVPYTR